MVARRAKMLATAFEKFVRESNAKKSDEAAEPAEERRQPQLEKPTPIQANARAVRLAEALNDLLAQPVAVLPNAVGDEVRPVKIGVFNDMKPLLQPEIAEVQLRHALGRNMRANKSYLLALAQQGAMRHDIDGVPVEPVSKQHQVGARKLYLASKKTSLKVESAPNAQAA